MYKVPLHVIEVYIRTFCPHEHNGSYWHNLTRATSITHPANVFKGRADDDNVKSHCWNNYLKLRNASQIHTTHAHQFNNVMSFVVLIGYGKCSCDMSGEGNGSTIQMHMPYINWRLGWAGSMHVSLWYIHSCNFIAVGGKNVRQTLCQWDCTHTSSY